MEAVYMSLKQRSTKLETDPSMRMKDPPHRTQNLPFEDLGSDFRQKPPRRSHKRHSRADRSQAITVSSSDEMDLIPRGPTNEETSKKQSKLSGSLVAEGSVESVGSGVMVDGKYYAYNQTLEARSKDLKTMKFTKNKKPSSDVSSDLASPVRARSPTVLPARTKACDEDRARLAKPFRTPTMVQSKAEEQVVKDASPRSRASSSSRSSNVHSAGTAVMTEDKDLQTARQQRQPRPRPRPRPAYIPTDNDTQSKSDARTRVKEKKLAAYPMDDPSPPEEESHAAPQGKDKVRPFPMGDYSPAKHTSPTDDDAEITIREFPMSPPKRKDAARPDKTGKPADPPFSPPPPRASSSKVLPATIAAPASRPVQRFPELSPLSAPAGQRQSKNSQARLLPGPKSRTRKNTKVVRGRILSDSELSDITESSEDEASRQSRRKVQPFPMSTQVLQSIGPSSAKRGSSESMEENFSDEEARERKRARGGDEILRELMRSEDMVESDDELFMDPEIDPSTLCSWCDEPLPPAPSPYLEKLIAAARVRSYRDARPSNPLGLHAPATVFLNVCHRHRFERHHFPLAQQRGWPLQIEWEKLAGRVVRLRARLQAIVDDMDEDFEPDQERTQEEDSHKSMSNMEDDELLLDTRPRKGSVFWIEIVHGVKQRGLGNTAGIRAQMSSFSKTQPGYYGELGSMILSQTLYDLFPPRSFPANSTLPLTPAEFVQRMLLPEAAVSLIMEDMHQTRREAIATMHESAQYGVAMFPDDQGEATSAGETIVKKRAAARRKQLQEEEKDEDTGGPPTSSAVSSKPDSRSSVTLSDSHFDAQIRRNTGRKATTRNYEESDDSDVIMVTDSGVSDAAKGKKRQTQRPAKPRSRKGKQSETSDAPPSSLPDAPGRPRPKPRLRAPETTTIDISESEFERRASEAETITSESEETSNFYPFNSQKQIRWGPDGKPQVSERIEEGLWITSEATPKPKKTKVKLSSSRPSAQLHIQPLPVTRLSAVASSSSKAAQEQSQWKHDLRSPTSDD